MRKLKIYLPTACVIASLLFFGAYASSLVYVNANQKEYERIKQEISRTENAISALKKSEGIYNIISVKLTALEAILKDKKSFIKAISKIEDLRGYDVNFASVNMDSSGKVSFGVSASSSAQVDYFVSILLNEEKKRIFSNIEAQSFMKDKQGDYNFGIALKIDPNMFK